jgi:hypothetical protein
MTIRSRRNAERERMLVPRWRKYQPWSSQANAELVARFAIQFALPRIIAPLVLEARDDR